jgi:hypothetical protein
MAMTKLHTTGKLGCFLLTATFSTLSAAAAVKNLCTPDEQVFFSCELPKKIVSLCSAGNAGAGYMEYRFGQPGDIELRYRGGSGANAAFMRTDVLGASNAADVIWFENRGVHYVLNFPVRGAPSLEVIKSGRTLARMSCKNGWGSSSGDPAARSPFIVDKPTGSYPELPDIGKR